MGYTYVVTQGERKINLSHDYYQGYHEMLKPVSVTQKRNSLQKI